MQINLKPDISLLIVMAIFVANYFVVRRFFLKPIAEVLDAREHEARTAEALYEQSLSRFNEATANMEEQLHVAKREASQLRDRFRGEAASHRNAVVEKTTGEAKAIVGEADTKLSSDVAVARERIVRESEALAHLAAERILGRAV
jgi:F0F1-type ATP synthase membrane subunit b/b'